MPPLLRVINLSKKFGTLPALSQVSLDVLSSEVIGLAGRSGSGKSVLVSILAGGSECRVPAWITANDCLHNSPSIPASQLPATHGGQEQNAFLPSCSKFTDRQLQVILAQLLDWDFGFQECPDFSGG